MALGPGRAQIDIDTCLICTNFASLGIAQDKQLGGQFSALLFNFISQGIRI
jgi:hypothetical protein